MESLTAKQRYRVKKGLKLNTIFKVTKETARSYEKEITVVFRESFRDYPNIYKPKTDYTLLASNLIGILDNDRNELFLVEDKQTKAIVGFALCKVENEMVHLKQVKVNPDFLDNEVNAALAFEVCHHYLNERGLMYILDGERNIRHITNYQEFLCRVLGFRNVPCKLHVIYHPRVKCIVKLLYPFRKLISALQNIHPFIYNVACTLKQEELAKQS